MNVCVMLHGLGPPPSGRTKDEARYWVSLDQFAQVIDLARGTNIWITFDDGNDTDISIAFPALQEAGLTASFYIPSDRIGTPGYVSEADIHMLHQAGMEIGSHGCAHIRWTEISDDAIVDDVKRSTDRLGAIIGEPVSTVAVPFGECDRRVLHVLRGLGITRVHTSFRGPDPGGQWIVRRDCITADMSDDAVRKLLTKKYSQIDAALPFLRMWRKAGRAALWSEGPQA